MRDEHIERLITESSRLIEQSRTLIHRLKSLKMQVDFLLEANMRRLGNAEKDAGASGTRLDGDESSG